jgi:hypothetical protein
MNPETPHLFRNQFEYLLNGRGDQPAPDYLRTPAMRTAAIAQHAINNMHTQAPANVHPPPTLRGPTPLNGPAAPFSSLPGMLPVRGPQPVRGLVNALPPTVPVGALFRMSPGPTPPPMHAPGQVPNVYPAQLGKREG